MNIRALEYLIAFSQEGSFTRAAIRSHVSQPTLSTQIKRLEETLGVELIERTPGRQILTPAGREVVYYARRMQADMSRIRQAARRLADPWASAVVLGVFPTLGPYLLPHIIPTLQRQKANLTVRFVEERSAQLVKKLDTGQLDAVLLSEPIASSAIKSCHVFDEDFLLAAPAGSQLGHTTTPIDVSELCGQKVMLLEDGHCMRRNALDVCQKVGAKQSDFRATSLETLRYMVASGHEVTLLPRLSTLPPIAQPAGVVLREFKSPKPYRSIYLNWRSASPVDAIMEGLAKLMGSVCTGLHHDLQAGVNNN